MEGVDVLPENTIPWKNSTSIMRKYDAKEIAENWRKTREAQEKEYTTIASMKNSTFLFNHNGERVYPTIVKII